MSKLKFKDVPVGTDFGLGDYFHWKNSPTTAVMETSGEVNEWEPDTIVDFEEEIVENKCFMVDGKLMNVYEVLEHIKTISDDEESRDHE